MTGTSEATIRAALRYWDLDCPWIDKEEQRQRTFEARQALDRLLAERADMAQLLLDMGGAAKQVGNAYGCFVGCTGNLPGAPPDAHTPACKAMRSCLARLSALGDGTADR